MPLLYREAPLNSVWEGSGNVNALDVLRALAREPEALEAWITEVGLARGGDARLDAAIDSTLALLGELMGDPDGLEVGARRLAGRMAAVPPGLAAGALLAARGGRRLLRLTARLVVRRDVRRARRWRPARDRRADDADDLSGQRLAPKGSRRCRPSRRASGGSARRRARRPTTHADPSSSVYMTWPSRSSFGPAARHRPLQDHRCRRIGRGVVTIDLHYEQLRRLALLALEDDLVPDGDTAGLMS